MHEGIWTTILGLFGLITIAVLMLPVTRRVAVPYTVLLAIVGIGLGLALNLVANIHLGIISDFFGAAGSFALSSDIIFFVFLPALVFESALSIDVRRLFADIGPILFLAVGGLLVSAFLMAGAIWSVAAMPFLVCLLLGAILSATDPVAVVAIFKDLGAPKRLAVLVEGESLFNDATAIVLFNIIALMILSGIEANILDGVVDFVVVFAGGVIVGLIMARIFAWVIAHVQQIALVEVTLTIALAYLSYLVAEHYLHVSGVMATVTAALVMGSFGRTSISSQGWHLLQETWENLGFWANSLIFVLVGMAVPQILSFMTIQLAFVLVIALLSAFAARGLLTHGLLPLMARLKLGMPVSNGFRTVMWWGGLRGAVSLALALAIYENAAFPLAVREFIITLVCGFVLFTLFVNATTVGLVMQAFGLDKLSPTDMAIRNRAIGRVLKTISGNLPKFALQQRIDAEVAEQVVETYQTRAQENAIRCANEERLLSSEDWIKVGLLAILGQERRGYLSHYALGHVAPHIARELLSVSDEMIECTKADGQHGWLRSHDKVMGFDWHFHLALHLQRKFGLTSLLSKRLANRFERLRTMRVVALDVRNGKLNEIAALVDGNIVDNLVCLMEERIEGMETAISAIRMQYPDYSLQLEQRYLERCTIRQERQSYQQMHEEAVIGGEVYQSLSDELDSRYSRLTQQTPLDLGLEPADLIAKVPLFSDLPDEQKMAIAGLLRPSLSFPDETLIHKGAIGDSMYFISSGALSVEIEPKRVIIGTGGFVGEMALLNDAPRTANVTSVGFCDLLILHKKDFQKLMAVNQGLRLAIERVAQQRR